MLKSIKFDAWNLNETKAHIHNIETELTLANNLMDIFVDKYGVIYYFVLILNIMEKYIFNLPPLHFFLLFR